MSKGGDDAQEGYSQEEAKGASELADQRVDGKDQDLVEKKLSKVDRKISMQDPSKLLAEFFNGVVIELDEEYKYDS